MFFILLFSFSFLNSMEDPKQAFLVHGERSSAAVQSDNDLEVLDKINATKNQIAILKHQKEVARELFEQRLRELQARRRQLKGQVKAQQEDYFQDNLETIALQGSAFALERAADYGYDCLFNQEEELSSVQECGAALFTCVKQIAINPLLLKCLMNITKLNAGNRTIFCHRYVFNPNDEELCLLVDGIKKKNQDGQHSSLTMRLISECFRANPSYNDGLGVQVAFTALGTVLLIPTMAVDMSRAAISCLGLKK